MRRWTVYVSTGEVGFVCPWAQACSTSSPRSPRNASGKGVRFLKMGLPPTYTSEDGTSSYGNSKVDLMLKNALSPPDPVWHQLGQAYPPPSRRGTQASGFCDRREGSGLLLTRLLEVRAASYFKGLQDMESFERLSQRRRNVHGSVLWNPVGLIRIYWSAF